MEHMTDTLRKALAEKHMLVAVGCYSQQCYKQRPLNRNGGTVTQDTGINQGLGVPPGGSQIVNWRVSILINVPASRTVGTRGVQIRSETNPNPIRSDFGTKIFISDQID